MKTVLLLCLGLPFATYASPSEQGAEFRLLVKKLVEAQRNFDTSTLSALLHHDYVEISPIGEVDHRDRVLSFYQSSDKDAGQHSPKIDITELEVKTKGDYAFVIVKETFNAPNSQGKFAMRASFTMIKTSSSWLFYNAQYTPIRSKSSN